MEIKFMGILIVEDIKSQKHHYYLAGYYDHSLWKIISVGIPEHAQPVTGLLTSLYDPRLDAVVKNKGYEEITELDDFQDKYVYVGENKKCIGRVINIQRFHNIPE
ncbi:MAG: hypothetical protein KKG59_01935 [Nanoarchaeota archaeon]|nr:hypothetical protein [Nanoarchaeota archaeon]